MDFNATIDLIIKDLTEAGDIIEDLKKYPGVPPLQVEMAKLKCRSAAEVISMLKTMKEPSSTAVTETVPRSVILKPSAEETDMTVDVSEIIVLAEDKKLPEPEIHEPDPPKVIKEPLQKKALVNDHDPTILADQFSHLSNRFNEQLGSMKVEADISDKLKTQHLDSLAEAIGINDKFFFIREIFNGNQNDYAQAISRLESAENFVDASAVIMSYTGDNNGNEAVKQLLDLVKRKLASDE